MEILIDNCSENEMDLIRSYVNEFRLDDEDLKTTQFLVARSAKSELLGFGRLRKHPDSLELCTLGVLPDYRGRGIGKKLVSQLIACAGEDLYVVCIIPDFFKKFGFEMVKEIPDSIKRKFTICTIVLAVEEPYFSMKLSKKTSPRSIGHPSPAEEGQG